MKNWLMKSQPSKLAAHGEVTECLTTLIFFHWDISLEPRCFCYLADKIQPFVTENRRLASSYLLKVIQRARKYDNARLVLIEKKVDNDSGHQLLLIIDLETDIIYILNPKTSSYEIAPAMTSKEFMSLHLSYKLTRLTKPPMKMFLRTWII